MSESCKVSSERRGDVAILWTDGYIKHRASNIGTRASEVVIIEVK